MSADATDAELDAADAEVDAEEFPAPPRTFTDDEGRVLRLCAGGESAESGEESAESDGKSADSDVQSVESDGESASESASDAPASDARDALGAMYDAFESGGRAQGIPPANPRRRAEWLDRLHEGIGVVAWHGDGAVGHGILLDGGPGHELALFVHPEYRGAGVGTALLRTLLGRGRSAGVERVWLSVERTNRPAVGLYRGAGFEPTGGAVGELEMARSLQ
ncbi:GNAT family N-acetyltransferase [Halorussus gelatinilyticus]|uniref:GNAT family N-acetyltransferase n=1 Tax=Halorussus gelatinilyticus TaxID=2937524 RepID=A0A8U0III4_9EURY|nr:GNAT family N-acetyltransferase [Halorussus gelatinilyticus]UPW00481.1 GNAT family N-acetyltransferase [Halorussus gelatinilyticus]